MFVFSISLLFVGMIAAIFNLVATEERFNNSIGKISLVVAMMAFMFGGLLFNGLLHGIDPNEPTALDVYKNKTELKVKYEVVNNDTIITDSVVVFKNKK